MKKIFSLLFGILIPFGLSADAVPTLQLFIAGGTYDNATQTWVTNANSFDLYVIGANEALNDVIISMALNLPQTDDPNGLATITIDGTPYNTWTYGTPNMLPPHDIYPTWYSEFNAGDFGLVGGVANTNWPDYYDPSTQGYLTGSNTLGEFRSFHVDISGTDYAHFDGYFYFQDKRGVTKIKFAPFSHDAESSNTIPEPGTLALLGLGGLGMGIIRKFRK
jgi:hypothetical protein